MQDTVCGMVNFFSCEGFPTHNTVKVVYLRDYRAALTPSDLVGVLI
jgi:hypothetical protein